MFTCIIVNSKGQTLQVNSSALSSLKFTGLLSEWTLLNASSFSEQTLCTVELYLDNSLVLVQRGTFEQYSRILMGTQLSNVQIHHVTQGAILECITQGIFPEGNYRLCIEISGASPTKVCESFWYDGMNNRNLLQLSYPHHKTILKEEQTNFVWNSVINVSHYQYDYFISSNKVNRTPLLQRSIAMTPSYTLVSSEMALEKEKDYYWGVVVKVEGKVIARSELWSFQVEKKQEALVPLKTYIDLSKVSGNSMFVLLENLKLKNEPNSGEVKSLVKIYTKEGEKLVAEVPLRFYLQEIYQTINLEELGLIHKKQYVVRIQTGSNQQEFTIIYLSPEFFNQ